MKTIPLFAILLLVVIPSNACGSFSPTQVTDIGDQTEEAEIRSVVEGFGQRLQFVSLQSPEAPQEINAQYGGFVASTLLEAWMGDISQAPGRMVSSPWPDRIEVSTLKQIQDEGYQVGGYVVYMTSFEASQGGSASDAPVKIVLHKTQDSWLITEYNEAPAPVATQIPGSKFAGKTPILPSPFPKPSATLDAPLTSSTPFPTQVISQAESPEMLVNEIHFKRGGTSAYIQKSISAGNPQTYLLRALAGQTLILGVSSSDNDVFLDLLGLESNVRLVRAADKISHWVGELPLDQPYQVTLRTDNPDTTYFLHIEIPAVIQFEPGAYSARVDGYVAVHTDKYPDLMTRVRYLAHAFAGQTMTVTLKSPNLDHLAIGIIGQKDGQAYIRYQIKNNGGEVHLPATQGYYLDVYSISGRSTAYRLEITIR